MQPFRCPKCKVATSRDKDFCVGCGEALTVVCGGCGKNWRFYLGYKFCPTCGNAVSHSREEIKHKKEK